MWLMGDFNNWNKFELPLKKLDFGKWEIELPPKDNGECRVDHMSKLKLVIKGPDGQIHERFFSFFTILLFISNSIT
jgi:1,4-alpha-glucan branching enzyme